MAGLNPLRVTRFAPSPTGPLHLGHACAALVAASRGDRFLLRIEDIDTARSKPEYEAAIYEDLAWLGLSWQTPILRQSQRLPLYQNALERLTKMGLTYGCHCTRGDIKAALSAPQEGAPMIGPDGPVYPGICRDLGFTDGAIRLNMAAAMDHLGHDLTWQETGLKTALETGEKTVQMRVTRAAMVETVGDIVLARRDIGTSYHLAVVVDDAAQAITEVTRGADLAEATPVHVLLQHLLGFSVPAYHHHRLIRDDQGKRLAKRDDARALSKYRREGHSPDSIRAMIGF